MNTQDILLFENGSGGEMAVIDNDIAMVDSLYQQVYLALFGGNVEASTAGNEIATQIRNDYWQNALLYPNDPGRQFNSTTELALLNNALNSTGRVNIERAVIADLQYLIGIAKVTVNVVILSTNVIKISVVLSQPNNLQDVKLQVLWDNAKSEMIIDRII